MSKLVAHIKELRDGKQMIAMRCNMERIRDINTCITATGQYYINTCTAATGQYYWKSFLFNHVGNGMKAHTRKELMTRRVHASSSVLLCPILQYLLERLFVNLVFKIINLIRLFVERICCNLQLMIICTLENAIVFLPKISICISNA